MLDDLAADTPLPTRQRFLLVQALTETGDIARATAELDALSALPLTPEDRARAHLLAAVLALTGDGDARRWIDAARAGPLSPDDRAYTDALLADATPDAVRHLERAVGLNSRHVQARALLSHLLLLLGRVDDALRLAEQSQLLFTDHPAFPAVIALGCGFRGEADRAEAALDALGRVRPADEVAAVREFVAVLPFVHRELRAGIYNLPRVTVDERARHTAALQRFRELAPHLLTGMRLPPAIRTAVAIVFQCCHRLLGYRDDGTPLDVLDRAVPEDRLKDLETAVGRHPEGVAMTLYAQGLLEAANALPIEELDRYRTAVARSAEVYTAAADRPAWTGVRDIALTHAAVCYSVAGLPKRPPPVSVRQDWLDAGADAARARWVVGSVPSETFPLLIRVSEKAGRYSLARLMVDDWGRTAPDALAVERVRARVELAAGNPTAALAAATKCLEKNPDDADMLAIRKACQK